MKILIIALFSVITVDSKEQRIINGINQSIPMSNISPIKLFEGEKVFFSNNFNLSPSNETFLGNATFKCWMDYEKVGVLINWKNKQIQIGSTSNVSVNFSVLVLAKRLGGSNLICSLNLSNNSRVKMEKKLIEIIVSRKQTVAELIFRIVVSIFVIFLTFVMGCGLDKEIILGYLKKPISPLIGFCSQFVFMPLVSAALGKFTGIHPAFGLGLLTIGCSPGGGASNIWTILFGGDMDLSITMTFISSCAALAMMPFWMFILSRFFIDPNSVQIPYGSIGLNLLQIVLPVGIGIAFQWKWDKAAETLVKKVKIMGLVFVIFILTYGSYANFYIYKLMGDYTYLLPIGALLPWLGFFFGFILSVVTRRKKSQAIAISLETGFQNIGIAILILKFSMPQPDGDLGSVMPIIVALFTPMPLYVGMLFIYIKKCLSKPEQLATEVKMDPVVEQTKENHSQ
uniref:Slc10a-5 n=1 Tax=Schmidtea mediterranea TaxID=79327 RepID=A0A0H3YF76_SCHMD|nr:slc10a-5 [Schmidtea mediterranea]